MTRIDDYKDCKQIFTVHNKNKSGRIRTTESYSKEKQHWRFCKQLFYAMQVHGLLFFRDPDMSAVTFAMTVHGLMDYGEDQKRAEQKTKGTKPEKTMRDYLHWFCEENGQVL